MESLYRFICQFQREPAPLALAAASPSCRLAVEAGAGGFAVAVAAASGLEARAALHVCLAACLTDPAARAEAAEREQERDGRYFAALCDGAPFLRGVPSWLSLLHWAPRSFFARVGAVGAGGEGEEATPVASGDAHEQRVVSVRGDGLPVEVLAACVWWLRRPASARAVRYVARSPCVDHEGGWSGDEETPARPPLDVSAFSDAAALALLRGLVAAVDVSAPHDSLARAATAAGRAALSVPRLLRVHAATLRTLDVYGAAHCVWPGVLRAPDAAPSSGETSSSSSSTSFVSETSSSAGGVEDATPCDDYEAADASGLLQLNLSRQPLRHLWWLCTSLARSPQSPLPVLHLREVYLLKCHTLTSLAPLLCGGVCTPFLRVLDLFDTRLASLRITHAESCASLEELCLAWCPLRRLHVGVQCLPALRRLDLADSGVEDLSWWTAERCPALREVRTINSSALGPRALDALPRAALALRLLDCSLPSPGAAAALVALGRLPALEALWLSTAGQAVDGADMFAPRTPFPRLRFLDAGRVSLPLRALLRPDCGLRVLSLHDGALTAEPAAGEPADAVAVPLQVLNLRGTDVSAFGDVGQVWPRLREALLVGCSGALRLGAFCRAPQLETLCVVAGSSGGEETALDLAPLSACPLLRHLTLGVAVASVAPLAACALQTLQLLQVSTLTDTRPLAACADLCEVTLRGCRQLTSLRGLRGLPKLRATTVADCPSLRVLDLFPPDPPHGEPCQLPRLEALTLHRCKSLCSLGARVAERCPRLRHACATACPRLPAPHARDALRGVPHITLDEPSL